jgi:hypothetical protein
MPELGYSWCQGISFFTFASLVCTHFRPTLSPHARRSFDCLIIFHNAAECRGFASLQILCGLSSPLLLFTTLVHCRRSLVPFDVNNSLRLYMYLALFVTSFSIV